MPVRLNVFRAVAAALVLCGPLLGYAAARRAPASPPPKGHHVYRLDYTVSVAEPGKPAQVSNYTMNVEEETRGDIHVGANVPLSASSPGGPRQDVGLAIVCDVKRLGDQLLLHTSTEMSGPEEGADQGPRAIRKISAHGDAVAALGKPTVVTSVQEPVSHARYEVTVTATKLR